MSKWVPALLDEGGQTGSQRWQFRVMMLTRPQGKLSHPCYCHRSYQPLAEELGWEQRSLCYRQRVRVEERRQDPCAQAGIEPKSS